ncbi:MAG: hypothetical protein AAF518_19410 [Spirochaetota bacterium]
MELFNNDKQAQDFYEFQEARKEFTHENKTMKRSIKRQTIDPENIAYDEIHIQIYSLSDLGKDWRVEEIQSTKEIQIVSASFQKVSKHFTILRQMNRKIQSSWIANIIRKVFHKK